MSSLEGGVAGLFCWGKGAVGLFCWGRCMIPPLARNCWCRRLGRKEEDGITCILGLVINPQFLKSENKKEN